jgi:quinol monooxygenase YgiN
MDEALKLFRDLIPIVRGEEGTLFYTLNRDMSEPNLLLVMERYRHMNALQSHSSSTAFSEFSKKIGALMEGKLEMSLLEELESI